MRARANKWDQRAQHVSWAKQRALEYVDRGDLEGAFASIASDLAKHEMTATHIGVPLGFQLLVQGRLNTPEKMRKFIEDFQ